MRSVAAIANTNIDVGDHITRTFLGIKWNIDTITSTSVALIVVAGLGLWMARSATHLVPGKLQLFFESVVEQVEDQIGMDLRRRAPMLVPLAVTIFIFILVANWISVIPSGHKPEYLPPPTSDISLPLAMGLTVWLWSLGAGIRRRGLRNYLGHLKEPYLALLPINILEELIKPITLALRLFGNIFAGTVLVLLISKLPIFVLWAPDVVWKLFDMFIGAIQAFIFALLTILYFATAIGPEEAH
jgi:F-type H+-transporting ATPase subunit a